MDFRYGRPSWFDAVPDLRTNSIVFSVCAWARCFEWRLRPGHSGEELTGSACVCGSSCGVVHGPRSPCDSGCCQGCDCVRGCFRGRVPRLLRFPRARPLHSAKTTRGPPHAYYAWGGACACHAPRIICVGRGVCALPAPRIICVGRGVCLPRPTHIMRGAGRRAFFAERSRGPRKQPKPRAAAAEAATDATASFSSAAVAA